MVNVLFLVEFIGTVVAASHQTYSCSELLGIRYCTPTTADANRVHVVIAVIVLWVAVDVILGVLWMVTRGRECPVCGRRVRRGDVICGSCGHDFRITA